MMVQKPTPHVTDLSSAMKRVMSSHQVIIDGISDHAEAHAQRLADRRKQLEHDNAVAAGIERQAAGLQAGSTGSAPVTLRVLDSNNQCRPGVPHGGNVCNTRHYQQGCRIDDHRRGVATTSR